MDLATPQVEIHTIERERAREAPGDARHLQQQLSVTLVRGALGVPSVWSAWRVGRRWRHHFAETEYSALKLAGASTRLMSILLRSCLSTIEGIVSEYFM